MNIKYAIVAILLGATSLSSIALAQSAGLLFERDPRTNQLIGRSPGNGVPTPSRGAAPSREQFLSTLEGSYTVAPQLKEQQLQATGKEPEQYKGYNNRNLESTYFICRYEAVRTEPPGNPGRDPIRKIQIRQSVFEICMNREGFFRKGRAPMLDLSMASFNDWWFGW